MSRIKVMYPSEFTEVADRSWKPVFLEGTAIPGFLHGIPEHLRHSIIASGELISETPYQSRRIRDGRLVGGFDVYRHAWDDPAPLNKDWYAVIASQAHPDTLLVEGPFKDDEHWLLEIPQRYAGAETIGVRIL